MLRFDDTYCARQVGVRAGNALQESSPCRIDLQCRVRLQRLGEVGSPEAKAYLSWSCNVRRRNNEALLTRRTMSPSLVVGMHLLAICNM